MSLSAPLACAALLGAAGVIVMFDTKTCQPKSGFAPPRWLAEDAGKRWTEIFFLAYSLLWIGALAVIVATGAYEQFEEWSYMFVGIGTSFPCFLGPLLFPGQGEPKTPLMSRFWVKANLWLFILSFIGNYVWTHYFYSLLGASYTFKAWRLNNVPFALFLVTHAYFTMYHSLTSILLRRFWSSFTYQRRGAIGRAVLSCLYVGLLAYVTAFMETLTISGFPYYTFTNKEYMYRVGSAMYGIYFIVTFPMYFRVGEAIADRGWDLWRVAVDAFGACMIVTLLLDFWRLGMGGVVGSAGHNDALPWM